eukprot:1020922-Pyramimonas_sp.AAC.1
MRVTPSFLCSGVYVRVWFDLADEVRPGPAGVALCRFGSPCCGFWRRRFSHAQRTTRGRSI